MDVAIDGGGRTLVLTGEAAALEAYLATAGQLVYNGPGQFSGAAMPVTLTLSQGDESSTVTLLLDEPQQPTSTDPNIRLRLQTADPAGSGWVNLAFPRPGSGDSSPLIPAGDVAAGQVIFVELEAPRAALEVAGLAANAYGSVGNGITVAPGSVIASASGAFDAVRFIGTASDLNAFFATAGNVRYDASTGAASVAARVGSYGLVVSGPAPVAGATLRVTGVAGAEVVYTVTADDLTAVGNGSGGPATADVARAHVAAGLAQAINGAAGSFVTATAVGASLQLTRLGGPITLGASVTGGEMQLAVLGTTQTRGLIPIARPNGAGVVLNLPAQQVFNDQQLPFLNFPSDTLVTTDTSLPIALTLSVAGGTTLSWVHTGDVEVSVSRGAVQGALVDSGSTVTLSGSVDALNAWLSTPGNVLYDGTVPTTLTAAVRAVTSVGGPVLDASLSGEVLIRPASTPTVALQLPTAMTLAPDRSGDAALFVLGDALAATGGLGSLTLTLVAPASGAFTSVFRDDVVDGAGPDGVLVTDAITLSIGGEDRSAVQLQGSAVDLNRYLRTVGNLRYAGPAGATLEWRAFNDSGVAGAGALATAGVDLLQAPQRIVPKLMLPAGVTLVAGADSPLQLEDAVGVSAAATSVDGSLVRLTLSAPSAVFGAHLTADDSVSVSTPGGQTLTVTGTVQALTDWLQAGNLTLRATTAQSLSVELRRAGPDGQMLSAADAALLASGRLDVTLHPATGAVLNPALVLPGRLAVQPGVDSPVVLGAQAFGAGTDETLRATLRVGDGVLAIAGWDAEDSGTLTVQVDGQAQSVTVSAFIADGSGGW